jgi:hypothetical protein
MFNDLTNIGSGNTANVDTLNGWVELPKLPRANAIDFFSMGEGIVVATSSGLKWYGRDETGNAVELTNLSFGYTGGFLGVAAIPGSMSVYAWSKDTLFRVDYDGVGMSQNPYSTVLGYQQVLSVKVLETDDSGGSIAVLGDKGSGETLSHVAFDGGSMVEVQSINLTNDPLAISGGFGRMDVILGSQNSSTAYMYDGSQYVENNSIGKTYGGPVISLRSDGERKMVLHNDRINSYLWSGNQYELATALSYTIPTKGVALALHPSEQHYAYVDESGTLRYYMFDGTTMVENPHFQIQGLALTNTYTRPALYESKVISSNLANLVKLTVEENHDPSGVTNYEVSSDGGMTWNSIVPGGWMEVAEGTQFVLRSTLDAGDSVSTPRILRVVLETTYVGLSNLTAVSSSKPAPGVTFPTNSFPVDVIAGSDIRFTVETTGYVDFVEAFFPNGSVVMMTPKYDVTNENNEWIGQYLIPSSYTQGDLIGVSIYGYNGIIEKIYEKTAFLGVVDDMAGNVEIKLIQ